MLEIIMVLRISFIFIESLIGFHRKLSKVLQSPKCSFYPIGFLHHIETFWPSLQFFVLCHSLLQLAQLLVSGYMKSSITTIEKRYGLSSQKSGVLAAFNEVRGSLQLVFVTLSLIHPSFPPSNVADLAPILAAASKESKNDLRTAFHVTIKKWSSFEFIIRWKIHCLSIRTYWIVSLVLSNASATTAPTLPPFCSCLCPGGKHHPHCLCEFLWESSPPAAAHRGRSSAGLAGLAADGAAALPEWTVWLHRPHQLWAHTIYCQGVQQASGMTLLGSISSPQAVCFHLK